MSRFQLYGGNYCEKCSRYIRADDDSCQTARCTHETNMYKNWLGVAYHDKPDYINWNLKCKYYKEKGDGRPQKDHSRRRSS